MALGVVNDANVVPSILGCIEEALSRVELAAPGENADFQGGVLLAILVVGEGVFIGCIGAFPSRDRHYMFAGLPGARTTYFAPRVLQISD